VIIFNRERERDLIQFSVDYGKMFLTKNQLHGFHYNSRTADFWVDFEQCDIDRAIN